MAHKTQKDLLEHSEGQVRGFELNVVYFILSLLFSLQASVNNVRLTDEKQMKEQLSEGDDVFQWFKLQAAKGAYSAQVFV